MKKFINILFILFISITAFSQSSSLYFNQNLYQSIQLNPARQVNCKVVLGLPGISAENIYLKNTGLKYSDVFFPYENLQDSFYFDIDETFSRLSDVNSIFLNTKTGLWSTAFWIRDVQITFDAYLRSETNLSYPQSMFLLKDGNYFEDPNQFISFTNLGFNSTVFTEVALGASYEVAPGLTIGGKLKFLRGLVNFNTEEFMFDWHVATEEDLVYDYTFNTSFNFNTNIPLIVSYDDNGNISGIAQDSTFIQGIQDDPMSARNTLKQNKGLGIDLGIIYNINDKFELSASLLDVGTIKWKSTPTNISTEESEFVFSGLDVGGYIGTYGLFTSLKDKDIRDSIQQLVVQDFVDSLLFLSDPSITSNQYKTKLNAKLNFGLAYMPKDWLTLGFLYNGIFLNKLYSNYTLSATSMFWRGWSYTLSYTMSKHSMNNVGMGFSYKLGPLQMYIAGDNISLPLLAARYGVSPDKPYNKGIATNWVKNSNYINVSFGINFIFGCNGKKDYGLID